MTHAPKLRKGTLKFTKPEHIRHILKKGNGDNFRFIIEKTLKEGKNVQGSIESMQDLGEYLDKVYIDNFVKIVLEKAKNENYLKEYSFQDTILNLIKSKNISHEELNNLFEIFTVRIKNDPYYKLHAVPELIKTGKIIDEKLREFYKNAIANVEKVIEEFEDADYNDVLLVPHLVSMGGINNDELRDVFKLVAKKIEDHHYDLIMPDIINTGKIENTLLDDLFAIALEKANNGDNYGQETVLALINSGQIDNALLDKFFEIAIQKVDDDKHYAENIVPALICSGQIDNALLDDLFAIALKKAKNGDNYDQKTVPALIRSGQIDNTLLNEFFDVIVEKANDSPNYPQNIIVALINSGKIHNDKLNKFAKIAREKIDIYIDYENDNCYDNYYAKSILPALINCGHINPGEFFDIIAEKLGNSCNYPENIILALINTGNIRNAKLREFFKNTIEKLENSRNYPKNIIVALINSGQISSEELEESFENAIGKVESNDKYAWNLIPALINSGKIDEKVLNNLFATALEKTRNDDGDNSNIVVSLVNSGKIHNEKLREFFRVFVEKVKHQSINANILKNLIKDLPISRCHEGNAVEEKYKAQKNSQDKILELSGYSIGVLHFLHNNFLNEKLLEETVAVLENKPNYNIDIKFFTDNIDAIVENKYGMYFGYFIESIKKYKQVEEKDSVHFPVTLQNFTDYVENDSEVLFHVGEKSRVSIEDTKNKPWTKAWFLEDESRKHYLKSENFRTFQK